MSSPISRFFQFLFRAIADNFLLKLVSLALALVLYYSLKPRTTTNTLTIDPAAFTNSAPLETPRATSEQPTSSNSVSQTHE